MKSLKTAFNDSRRFPSANRQKCRIKHQPARRTLKFDGVSPVRKPTVLPSILLDGIKIDLNDPSTRLSHQFESTSSSINASPILQKYIFDNESPRGTPNLNTPEKETILENGRFKSWPVIGEGSFGTVIKAKHKGEKVAVKIISKNTSPKRESLRSERHALVLSHPGIVRIVNVFNSPYSNFGIVVMELWNSIDLQRFLEDSERELTFLQKVCCSLDVCRALNHCHEKRIVHLDVKPKNILIHKLGWPSKICDFGSSILMTDMDGYKHFSHHQGTIKYMAPELFKGSHTITEKADVYSLGITMWQLLTEETPYMGEDLHSVIYKVVSQNYRPSSSKSQKTHQEFISVYEKCWLENHTIRPSTAEIAKSLTRILEAVKNPLIISSY